MSFKALQEIVDKAKASGKALWELFWKMKSMRVRLPE